MRLLLTLLLLSAQTQVAQQPPSIKQESKGGACSNIVALAGDVRLNCSSLTPAQQRLIDSIPVLLQKILARQPESDLLMAKLDQVLVALRGHVEKKAQDEDKSEPPTLSIAPYVVTREMRAVHELGAEPITNYFYGLSAVLQVQNNGSSPQYVKQLEIVGDVLLDCNEYVLFIKSQNGTPLSKEREFFEECRVKQPYLHLSWIANPVGDTRVDANGDEKFIKFIISEPNSVGGRSLGAELVHYVGLKADDLKPKYETTLPCLEDILQWTRFVPAPRRSDNWKVPPYLDNPILKVPVLKGDVSFRVLLSSGRIDVTASEIRPIRQTSQRSWNDGLAKDLFFVRSTVLVPLGKDPAVTR